MANKTFDRYANEYDEVLARGLDVTGEDSAYYAAGRIDFLHRCLQGLDFAPRRVLDFGCGTGATSPLLAGVLGAERVTGFDDSRRSLEVARAKHGGNNIDFLPADRELPRGGFDLAYCNGVFHHIPPSLRRRPLEEIRDALVPGGFFAFWENNPWNPATYYIMSRIPFDADARMLSPLSAREMLRACRFRVIRTDFLFIFPRALRLLRRGERLVTRLPFGAQYQILCRR